MDWFDIGVNLTNERLPIEPLLNRAREAGVGAMMVTGTSVTESAKALQLCNLFPQNLCCTAGVHPHYASQVAANFIQQLRLLANDKKVKAIGECGLDFNRNLSPKAQQLSVFEQQLELAVETQKPVFLHERDAFSEQLSLLKKYRSSLIGGVVHCFTGNAKQMQAYLELDLFIGITGWVCDVNRGQELQAAVKSLPLDRLLLETDSPYLRPKGLPNNRKVDGGSNEPAYLPYIALQLADIMGVAFESVKTHSLANSHFLFGTIGEGHSNAD
jgi:TatD DNase family protein